MTKCDDGIKCILNMELCDGREDCFDKSDENTTSRGVPLLEQELHTLPNHLSSSPVFSGVCVSRSLALCVCFVDRCLSFCPFVLFRPWLA
jgi:hypothetical protein